MLAPPLDSFLLQEPSLMWELRPKGPGATGGNTQNTSSYLPPGRLLEDQLTRERTPPTLASKVGGSFLIPLGDRQDPFSPGCHTPLCWPWAAKTRSWSKGSGSL